MNWILEAMNRKALIAAALLAAGLSGQDAFGQAIFLENASFESPDIPEADLSLIDFTTISSQLELEFAIGALISRDEFDGAWVQTGPPSFFTDPPSEQSGVFSNQPISIPTYGINIAPIDNVDGDGIGFDQVGFMLADPFADGSSLESDYVSIHQESASVFQAGQDYRFELLAGLSTVFPAGNDAPLRIAIGYLDDSLEGSFAFQEVAGLDILASQILEGVNLAEVDQVPLKNFVLDLASEDVTADALGELIAVQIRVDVPNIPVEERFEIGGSFNFDNARLSAVPEPTSLALLALGGLVSMRRRR